MKMPVMEQLHKDHINYSKLLDSLETYLEELRQGGDKGYLEMRQIMDYMTRYPDIFHHPYEDIIFDEACKQEGDLVPLISDLISEHRKLKTASVTLCEDLDAVISGHIVEASFGVITSTSSPNTFAIEAPRLSSSKRSWLLATETDPFIRKPVAWPVSSSREANKLVVY